MELPKRNTDYRLNTFMISGIVLLIVSLVEREVKLVIRLLENEHLHSQIIFLTLSFAIILFFVGLVDKIRASARSTRNRHVTSILNFLTVFPLFTIGLLTILQSYIEWPKFYFSTREESIWHLIMNEANGIMTIAFLIIVAAQIARIVELVLAYKNSGWLSSDK